MLQEHFRNIVPEAKVDARVAMYSEEAEEELLEGKPDFVLDAIDNIDTKVALLAACRRRGVPVLCAAGAGACLCFLYICGRTLYTSSLLWAMHSKRGKHSPMRELCNTSHACQASYCWYLKGRWMGRNYMLIALLCLQALRLTRQRCASLTSARATWIPLRVRCATA